jgi:hypothetical protein
MLVEFKNEADRKAFDRDLLLKPGQRRASEAASLMAAMRLAQ